MRRSISVNATYEGVVQLPWSLVMISTRSCRESQTPTQEYVIPVSMLIAVPLPSPSILYLRIVIKKRVNGKMKESRGV